MVLLEVITVLDVFEWCMREVIGLLSRCDCRFIEVCFDFTNSLVESFVFVDQVFD